MVACRWAGLLLPRWGGTTNAQLQNLCFALPQALPQGRIAAGLSQKELAERLGLKEQQIQRDEATDDASASLTRICEVARSLGLKVKAVV